MLALLLLLGADAEASLRVAVVEFTNAADDDAFDSLGKGLQSMLTTDLSGVQSVQLVERSRMKEIQDELNLADSKWVDPTTAAKVGKLAGASHLLGGTFTVVGDTMRLDARMFDVKTGKVLLAEEQTGARDAFFELEKELVNKLILTLQVELSPKERAKVRRLHTADFDAFKEFSTGLEHFDEKRYDEALASLGGAVEADEDFKLARLTLDEYGEIIEKMRARADALDADEANRARIAEMSQDREDSQLVARLIDLASKEGAGAQRDRLAALHLLVLMYDSKLRHQDRFVRKVGRDAYMARYFAEAEPLWPQVPLFPRGTSSFGASSVRIDTFDVDFAKYTRLIWEGVPGMHEQYWKEGTRLNYVRGNIGERLSINYLAQWLHLDRREHAELFETSFQWLEKAGDPMELTDGGDRARWRAQAKRLTKLGEFDRSTALLKRLADSAEDGSQVRSIAKDIEQNATYKALLKPLSGLQEELVRLSIAGGGSWLKRDLESWEEEGLKSLTSKRRLSNCGLDTNNHGPTHIDGHAVWTMQRDKSLFTGARTDAKRGTGLRYYRRPPYKEGGTVGADSMLIVDGIPRDKVRIGFISTHQVPKDFAEPSSRAPLSKAQPSIDVLVGWHDLRTPEITDSVTREVVEKKMPAGFAVRIHADKVELVKREGVYDRSNQVDDWTEEVLESAKLRGGKARKVEVEVKGEAVTVSIDGSKQKWTAPGLKRGFYGFGFRGEGFVALDGLAVAQP